MYDYTHIRMIGAWHHVLFTFAIHIVVEAGKSHDIRIGGIHPMILFLFFLFFLFQDMLTWRSSSSSSSNYQLLQDSTCTFYSEHTISKDNQCPCSLPRCSAACYDIKRHHFLYKFGSLKKAWTAHQLYRREKRAQDGNTNPFE